MATSSKASAKSTQSHGATRKVVARKRWSQHVTETSDAMDLKPNVFKDGDATKIAKSVKSSAEHSGRRKTGPFQSAMSMLNFYINRAGHNLAPAQRTKLEEAKDVLRELFGREDAGAHDADHESGVKPARKKAATPRVARKTVAGTASRKAKPRS